MALATRWLIALPAAALALASLSGCGEEPAASTGTGSTAAGDALDDVATAGMLFSDDFKGVCTGASLSAATAYDPAAASHKAVYLATYKDDYVDRSHSLPDDWTVEWSPDGDALKAIDLVVCAKRTATKQVKVCDGYKDDGKPTRNKVRWHTANYALSIREATTGKVLAERTVEATSTDCPMFMSFDGDSDIVDDYANLSDSVVTEFLKPLIAK